MLWLTVVEWLARLILVILIGLSIWSIAIIIERRRYFNQLKLPSKKLTSEEDHFFKSMMDEIKSLSNSEKVDRAFDAFASEKRKELEKGLPILGTLGSTTPFIGLLGTILGIIVSFGELSSGAGSTDAVMFSLAEALILTAAGLVVAIPAVIAYNFFSRKVKFVLNEGSRLKDLHIAYRD
jgi:biopolymer transport protein ExbB